MLKLMVIAGARPNFMKIAPIVKAAQNRNRLSPEAEKLELRVVHTGQHYDSKMSDVFFEQLGIPAPDVNLAIGSGSHAVQTANIMTKFEPVVVEYRPDWVVVVGDVNSTVACTLVCSKIGIRVAHVEAGLRSFDRTMPEEINRVVTDALADLLLTPSEDANQNLAREGVAPEKVRLVGNVMIDALVANLEQARGSRVLERHGLHKKQFAYVTLHRPANVDEREPISRIMAGLRELSNQMPVIFPVHPRTRNRLEEFGLAPDAGSALIATEPLGYHDSLHLTESARLIVTDSGGLQEESTWFGTPCLTVRPNTERPVTITLGSNRLTKPETLTRDISEVLNNGISHGKIPPLWDGRTADRILDELIRHA